MQRCDANSAHCFVYTFKQGLLSPIAHDLKLRVGTFSITFDEVSSRVEAVFDARSLSVAATMHGGAERPDSLSASDQKKVEENIVRDVLDARRYPEIRFQSDKVARSVDGKQVQIDGSLTLHGITRALKVTACAADDGYVAEVTLHQPDFGITPFTALFGALRLEPQVVVKLAVPFPSA